MHAAYGSGAACSAGAFEASIDANAASAFGDVLGGSNTLNNTLDGDDGNDTLIGNGGIDTDRRPRL